MQLLVNQAPYLLDRAIARHLSFSATGKIDWRSPLAEEGYAKYLDQTFLSKADARADVAPLPSFWAAGSPAPFP
jgi:hypothetical protein